MKTILKRLVGSVDCIVAAMVIVGCFLLYALLLPWIFSYRSRWAATGKGNAKVLLIHGFNASEFQRRGHEFLRPFRNRWIEWVGIFDPANTTSQDIRVESDLFLIARKLPQVIHGVGWIGFKATATVLREAYSVSAIVRYCVEEKIGILRAYKHNFPALRVYLAWTLIRIPYIVDITGNYELIRRLNGKPFYFRQLTKFPLLGYFSPALTNWLLGVPLKHAAYVLGRNKNNYEHAFALGAPVERMSLLRVSNFNDMFNNFDSTQRPASPLPHPYMLFVGRMVLIKFPFDVIDAFDRAAQVLPDYRLVMIGDGACRREVEGRIAASRFKERILFLGAVSSQTVFAWTANARISICPFSGYTLAESMLCGVPVIAYDVENHSEVIIDGYTGYIVPFRNIAELSRSMISVAGNYRAAEMTGLRARDLARVAYDKRNIMEFEGKIYRQALGIALDENVIPETLHLPSAN